LITLGEEFYVVIDGHVLPDHPQDIYAAALHNRVELMLGCTSDEGAFLFNNLTKRFGIAPETLSVDVARVVMKRMLLSFWTVPNPERVADAVVAEYLPERSDWSTDDVHKKLVEFFGDFPILIPTVKTANWHSRMLFCRYRKPIIL
jgi:carboxylesterase type B